MAMVALLGSDRFGLIGGAIGIVVGPVVYLGLRKDNSQPSKTNEVV
jgi:hypothetical protein